MASYEIEIKSLLRVKEKADELISKLKVDPSFQKLGSHQQLNHYFIGGDLSKLYRNCKSLVSDEQQDTFARMSRSRDFSVRTRQADNKVLLVIKAAVDDTTSSNGTARLEFEAEVKLTLNDLDRIILDSGFQYQAKWSREREDYKYKGLNVSVDKNAGYGYLAEFESVIDDALKTEQTKSAIRECIALLGLEELPQDRLARMFDYYNKHWQDYYGTEKTFLID